MEPKKFRRIDAGPQALITSLEPAQNIRRLEWVLSRATGYVGVINILGTRFAAIRRNMEPVMKALNSRGLLVVDTITATIMPKIARNIGLPWAISEAIIDATATREAIDRRLKELERVAVRGNRVVGVGGTTAVTIGSVAWWITTLADKGIALAPVSAVAHLSPPQIPGQKPTENPAR
jgi:polysaccharide deacetylase 2 family uncharacterized protein YibQ